VLQHVAVCCSVLQRVTACCSMLHRVAVCCSVLQRVAACCRVLQGVAVCCSVLQCVAVRCSELHCVAVYCTLHVIYMWKARNTNAYTNHITCDGDVVTGQVDVCVCHVYVFNVCGCTWMYVNI